MEQPPKFVLMCHENAILDLKVMAAWLNDFAQLSGIVVIQESRKALYRRLHFEYRRSGFSGLFDVLAYRLFHRLFFHRQEKVFHEELCLRLARAFPDSLSSVPRVACTNPNSKKVADFIADCDCDILIARCKFILKERVFALPKLGTFVMHPGVCPEYRNAHGCFWALVNDDYQRVGMTLLKVDKGVDTGPVYGYFSCPFDTTLDTPNIVQTRVVYDNLSQIASRFMAIVREEAKPVDVSGRSSGVWGQPRLSHYLRWRFRLLLGGHPARKQDTNP